MTHVRAPLPYPHDKPVIFLAGSIEMGAATHWQEEIVAALADFDVTVLNPRRDAWDSTWVQDADNPVFREQVTWELDGQSRADLILFYFDPSTKSPVSMMELGLFKDRRVLVCCPDGFWRKGNVDLVCERFGIAQVDTFGAFLEAARDLASSLRS